MAVACMSDVSRLTDRWWKIRAETVRKWVGVVHCRANGRFALSRAERRGAPATVPTARSTEVAAKVGGMHHGCSEAHWDVRSNRDA